VAEGVIELWTSANQEQAMAAEFNARIAARQAAIDAQQVQTGVIHKYTAYAYEPHDNRVFRKTADGWTLVTSALGELGAVFLAPPAPEARGRRYCLGPAAHESPVPIEAAVKQRLFAGEVDAVFQNRGSLNGPRQDAYYCTLVDRQTQQIVQTLVTDDDLYNW
jgi:hypothetical protein